MFSTGSRVVDYGEDGFAAIVNCNGVSMRVIASWGGEWDHVSVSLPNRTPTWQEMEYVKRLYFKPEEWAIEYHAAVSDHINNHPFCLHIWRPQDGSIPTPPSEYV